MTDDARMDGSDDASGRTSRPKQPRRRRKSLSDEVVEDVKKEVLFGVGHKRPPKQHQFKKGQSGNPKGRPKAVDPDLAGDRSANALALKHAERLITVRDGDEYKQITTIDAVYRAQDATALKGNAYAQKHRIERYEKAYRERRQQIREEIEVWERYVAIVREEIAEAERKGETPPPRLPHPDDVVIDFEKGVRFAGPLNEEGVKQLEETCRLRDMLIMQDALDRREAREPDNKDPLDGSGMALLFATILNEGVPDRFKLGDDEVTLRMMRYLGIPKRQLLKDLYRGWRSLGARPRRGAVFPPTRVGKENLKLLIDLVQRFRDGRLDVNSPPEELEAEIAAIMLEREHEVKKMPPR